MARVDWPHEVESFLAIESESEDFLRTSAVADATQLLFKTKFQSTPRCVSEANCVLIKCR